MEFVYYSLVGIIALLVIFIINFDIIFAFRDNHNNSKAFSAYRLFLLATGIYCLTDVLWGILYHYQLVVATFIDTSIYFATMAIAVFAWVRFEVSYLNEKSVFDKIISIVGWVIFIAGIGAVIANIFTPILFSITENCEYDPGVARYAFLAVQLGMYLLTSIYATIIGIRGEGSTRTRHIAIAAVGLVMSTAIVLQLFFPLFPMYAIGCLTGECLLYKFVVMHEMAEYEKAAKESQTREAKQREELGSVKILAYTDILTGVKNKHSYVEREEEIDLLIRNDEMGDFSIAVFDLNDLKGVNDNFGHEIGDQYIIKSCSIISSFFPESELYRFGGDEFVLIITGEEYVNRHKTIEKFNKKMEKSVGTNEPIIATGISDYVRGKDNTLRAVFIRADERMYMRKRSLKELHDVQ